MKAGDNGKASRSTSAPHPLAAHILDKSSSRPSDTSIIAFA
jgi:hypothetical protein